MTILEDRLPMLDKVELLAGSHLPDDGEFCFMELVAYLAGEEWSYRPKCASPVLTTLLVSWNDDLNHADRQMLKPLWSKVIGTRTTKRDEEKRAWMCADWLARECAPAFLRLAGLTEHAEALEGLAALTTAKRAEKAQPALSAALSAAARSAAYSAALSAAISAALSAAYSAADSAALSAAARSAAYSAADSAAAISAADSAACESLAPTVKTLQASALQLVERMCEVGRK